MTRRPKFGPWHDYQLKGDPKCPHCGNLLDGAANTSGKGRPRRGDVSVCSFCITALVFDSPNTLRKATAEDIAALPDELMLKFEESRRASVLIAMLRKKERVF